MPAFATTTDLASRWKGYDPADNALAEQLLADASVWIRAWVPTADTCAATAGAADALTMVACSMVKRALINTDTEGQSSMTDTTGPWSLQVAFRNPDGNLYLTNAEKQLLDGLCGGNTAGAVSMTSPGL